LRVVVARGFKVDVVRGFSIVDARGQRTVLAGHRSAVAARGEGQIVHDERRGKRGRPGIGIDGTRIA
jgi:hypothetical protein